MGWLSKLWKKVFRKNRGKAATNDNPEPQVQAQIQTQESPENLETKTEPRMEQASNTEEQTPLWEPKKEERIRDLATNKRYEYLGEGTFGAVYHVSETQVAIKHFFLEERKKSRRDDTRERFSSNRKKYIEIIEIAQAEIDIMTDLKRANVPNIVDFIGAFFSSNPQDGLPQIHMEYMAGGTLKEAIKPSPRTNKEKLVQLFSSSVRLEMAKQITEALLVIQEAGYIVCDLKTENILLDAERKNAKLCDFGLLKRINNQDKDTAGTELYSPPEILAVIQKYAEHPKKKRAKEDQKSLNSIAADVYTLACVFYELLTWTLMDDGFLSQYEKGSAERKELERDDKKFFEAYRKEILAGHRLKLDKIYSKYHPIINACWAQNPKDRPYPKDVLKQLQEIENPIETQTAKLG